MNAHQRRVSRRAFKARFRQRIAAIRVEQATIPRELGMSPDVALLGLYLMPIAIRKVRRLHEIAGSK